ncbi:uncharacterized protein LOC103516619 [Diaphorina citri]|uniref:Uncharacterized protein LOC103516619 n=1 Tax=Diaphorina citri TaxID=121845 RepID=A0A1S3DDK8_DIACI|nr:uncharacterized protein LOC103516619 [Diaphorina citri]
MIAQQSQLASDINYSDSVNARASPRDAQVPRLTSVSNGRGLPGQGRDRLKKIVQKEKIRIGSLNLHTKFHVNRKSDRVIHVKLQLDVMELNVLSAYAPQVGCEDEEKDAFWRDVEEELGRIPDDERVFIGGHLNGHIGKGNTETAERIRGIWGLESQNEEGKRILDFALGSDWL